MYTFQEENPAPIDNIDTEDFFVLKFPQKLWRIVNECKTGAIAWGTYGKTILIDYNTFQAQYLECETPKFKTRNMTSFVRQLNMYGFKKMQTQIKNDSNRCCNIHEFFHTHFRFGRHDLLENVKRRPTPIKNARSGQPCSYQRSRVEMCRDALAKALQTSRDLYREEVQLEVNGEDEDYTCQVIPLESSIQDLEFNGPATEIPVEVTTEFEEYVNMDCEAPESTNEESGNDEFEPGECLVHRELANGADALTFMDQSEAAKYILDLSGNQYNDMRDNHLVQVKKGFDGTNYVIDIKVDCPNPAGNYMNTTEIFEDEMYEADDEDVPEDMTILQDEGEEKASVVLENETEIRESIEKVRTESIQQIDTTNNQEFYDSITQSYMRL